MPVLPTLQHCRTGVGLPVTPAINNALIKALELVMPMTDMESGVYDKDSRTYKAFESLVRVANEWHGQ